MFVLSFFLFTFAKIQRISVITEIIMLINLNGLFISQWKRNLSSYQHRYSSKIRYIHYRPLSH